MKAILTSKEPLTVSLVNDVLLETGFTRLEHAESDRSCVTLVEGILPDLVIIDADLKGLQIAWLADLCGVRRVPVVILTSDRFAGSPDPDIVVLRKPFMKQQLRIAVEAAIERHKSDDDDDGLPGTGRILRRD